MGANPAAPINFVEEPVHDHEQDDHREQSGRRLQMQGGNVLAQLLHESDSYEPGHKSGEECDRRAGHHRFAIASSRTGHAGGDGSEDKNAFESFAEKEEPNIEGRDGGGGMRLQRIGWTVGGDPLPDKNRDHEKRSEQQTDANDETV